MNFVALHENLSTRRKKQHNFFAIRTSSNTREKLSPAAGAGIEPKLTRVEKSGALLSPLCFVRCFQRLRCFKGPPTRNAFACEE